tara:strand:- start:341 stop:871 length:531 start_codon:yes stop_codon:yes gene_type:complete
MAKKKVTNHNFKTKRKDGKTYMICRNSIEDTSYNLWSFLEKHPRCNEWSETGPSTSAILCWRCVNKTVGPPEIKGGYISKGRPRGWQFMKEFVDPQGNVFHKGKEQVTLKGTLNPTIIDVTPKKKLSKQDKEELKTSIYQQISMVKGNLKKATFKKDINSGNSQLKKLARELKKIR